MSRLAAALVIVAVVACGSGPTRARRPGEEYLAKIEIEGNKAISDKTLIRGLALYRAQQGGRSLDEYQLSLDLTRIEGAYQRQGYLSVVVEPKVTLKGPAATLTFKVTEGPQARSTVEITGLPPEVSLDDARKLVDIEDNAPFDYLKYEQAKVPLVGLVENAGYAHAELDATVLADRANNHAILRYSFDLGPRVQFGAVEVVGVTGALADAVRQRANLDGATYSTQKVAETQQAIYGIGRFSSVRVDVDRANLAAVVPVKISVTVARRWELRAGGGAGVDTLNYQARLRFSLTHAGWPTPLSLLGVEFRPALSATRDNCTGYEVWTCDINPRLRLIGSAKQQDLFVRGLNGELEGGLDYLQLEAYTMEGARLRFGLALPLFLRRLTTRVGWQLGAYRFEDIHPAVDDATAARIGIDRFARVGAFTQSITVDYRDDPISPTFGGYGELRIAEGTAIAGGTFEYLQITPDIRGYFPLGRVVVAARARVGLIRGDVPPPERYYGGGASSQRGFAERRLSPLARSVDDNGNPISVVIGGAASMDTSLELRVPFRLWGEKFGAVTFVDGGDVTETPAELDPGQLHWAVGLGIRWYTAVGPFRVEVAYRLNRTGSDEPSPGERFNYILSIGEAF